MATRRCAVLCVLALAMLSFVEHDVLTAASEEPEDSQIYHHQSKLQMEALSEASKALMQKALDLGEDAGSPAAVIKAREELRNVFNAANAKLDQISGSKTKATKGRKGGKRWIAAFKRCQKRANAGRKRRQAFWAKRKVRRTAMKKIRMKSRARQKKARAGRKAARQARQGAMKALRKERDAYKAIAAAAEAGGELAEAQTGNPKLEELKKEAAALSAASAKAEKSAAGKEAVAAKEGASALKAEQSEDKEAEKAVVVDAWEGAYNSTQATADSSTDGKPLTTGPAAHFCSAQKTLTINGETRRDDSTCSACKAGGIVGNGTNPQYFPYAFVMTWHKSKVGVCNTMTQRVMKITCITIDKDKRTAGPEERNKMCTKYGIMEQPVPVDKTWLSEKYLTALKGLNGHAVAYCKFSKQIVCRKGDCKARKEVTCDKVCKLTSWHPDEATRKEGGKYMVDKASCTGEPCKTKYGPLFCTSAAMMG